MFVLHPEERAYRDVSQTRTRVRASRRMRTAAPSCFETHRSAFGLWRGLRSRRAATLLSMRARAKHQPAAVRMTAGAASLFPACYLQGVVQLQRVGWGRGHVAPSVVISYVTIRRH